MGTGYIDLSRGSFAKERNYQRTAFAFHGTCWALIMEQGPGPLNLNRLLAICSFDT